MEQEVSNCDFYAFVYWGECIDHENCQAQICGECGDTRQCETDPI